MAHVYTRRHGEQGTWRRQASYTRSKAASQIQQPVWFVSATIRDNQSPINQPGKQPNGSRTLVARPCRKGAKGIVWMIGFYLD